MKRKNPLEKLRNRLRNVYNMSYIRALEREIGENCKSLLDLGCGSSSPIKAFSQKIQYTVGIDLNADSIKKSSDHGIHSEHLIMNVLDIEKMFKGKTFDYVIALDVIEHFKKEDGLKLLSSIEKIAKKKIIIFTPNGFLPQNSYLDNDFQKHLSGWSVNEFKNRGFKVIGMQGWKPISKVLFSIYPSLFQYWLFEIFLITQIFVEKRPEKAFSLLCIKDL